jgi:hypothetical protein
MSDRRTKARARSSTPQIGGVRAATIVALSDLGVSVRVGVTDAAEEPAPARLTWLAGYTPSVGDRVLVAGEDELYVIAVVSAAKPASIALPGGATAAVEGEGLALRDPEGHLLIRYEPGKAVLAVPEGDLELCAPNGRIVIKSGLDVRVEAARDVEQRAGRKVTLGSGDDPQVRVERKTVSVRSERVEVESKAARAVVGQVALIARSVATTANEIAQNVDRYELTADRIVEKSRDVFRDVADLCQSRVGRARMLVSDVYSVFSRRAVMVSEDETSIDGKKILLG